VEVLIGTDEYDVVELDVELVVELEDSEEELLTVADEPSSEDAADVGAELEVGVGEFCCWADEDVWEGG